MLKSEQQIKRTSNILLLMSGSIACAKASSLISAWSKKGHKVRVACTRSVSEFVGRSTLEGLGAEMVFDNVFGAGQSMEHIALGQWADIVIAAPATSNLINKLAAGIADDAVTTLWQAAYGLEKPMVLVPAMNTRMWRYPATRESVRRLEQWGIQVLPVGEGELACGESGEGRMLEPEEVLTRLDRLLAQDEQGKGKRILITAGGTREPIDSVRFIGNMSSGRTAAVLADELSRAGHTVTWLGARDALRPELPMKLEYYSSFDDLKRQLQSLLAKQTYDAVIHAAAVSDFSVASLETSDGSTDQAAGKIPSGSELILHLKPNPKLLDSLKQWSANPGVRVIGFKLTDTMDLDQRLAAIQRQLDNPAVDTVVHNDLSEIDETRHLFHLHGKDHTPLACDSKGELAKFINRLLEDVT